jgi:hypothetical protein
MNERIKQLAIEAKKYALDAMIKITDKEQALKVYSESYDTKFAESIVQECIQSIQSDMDRETMNGTISLAKHAGMVSAKTVIKQHFGVQE